MRAKLAEYVSYSTQFTRDAKILTEEHELEMMSGDDVSCNLLVMT